MREPSFSEALKRRSESFLIKSPGLGVETVAGEPGKKPRQTGRKLGPSKKKVDYKPRSLGPEGTWKNDPDEEVEDRTQTIVQRGSTVTSFKRQDTLTD